MVIIVVGMHRSGTSGLAGVLHQSGIHMGDKDNFRPKPMKENKKGFFENHQFRTINDQILRENGYSVKSFDPGVPNPDEMLVSEGVRQRMVDLVSAYGVMHARWGWKDPRTCLTLGFWLGVLEQQGMTYKLVLTMRPKADIAESMRYRGNKERERGQFLRLAKAYYSTAHKHARRYGKDFIVVEYANLMYNTNNTVRYLTEELGVPVVNYGFIDPSLADRAKKGRPC